MLDPARRRPVTLHDVAREAGVAVSTASRALSDPGRVNVRTREHVQAVAKRLGYRPNRLAQALPTGRTGMLAILVPDITNPHNFGLVRGAEAQARAASSTLIIADTQGGPELETAHLDRLASSVDGFLLAASRLSDTELQDLAERLPVVLFNRRVEGLASLATDSADGSRQIVEHLAALGHRSLAYLAGPSGGWSDAERWRALSEHAAASGIGIVRCGPFPPTLDGGPAAADVGLATGATALIAFNDLLAIGVLRRLAERGVPVPAHVSVVGYDDIFGADFCSPTLTTVAGPVDDAGRMLVDVLQAGRTPEPVITLPTHLRIRNSTGPAPAPPGG
ncbi:LacI family transcriptional regulator [Blastococcus sp. CT_GayMR19]|nr:LacI family transcriptional regulator [Blastococcus sp. CT_GayMR19]